ncbi:glycoside hydrolase family 6 protein [Nonomuraea diastatica]|uniref:Glucanase n=1 Tax=Nonomuraea diastatica TaxID=1848329 RepID=A0A4R4WPX2_9ACTN|nr:glycoside hydrolase family 6 protein [Nonomuraea diastatica]TDD19243.1 cellobiohydrolase [Nonomuraea diastatica]
MRLQRGLRKWAVTMTAVSVAALGLVVGQSTAASAAVACDVTYSANSWTSSPGQGGFTANITLRNTGDALSSWTLAFDYPTTSQRYTPSGWGASWSQSGTRVTGTNMSYNGNLAAGASISVGYNGTWSGSNPDPTSFSVNGTTCGDTTPANPSVVTSSSTVAVDEGGTATFTARLSAAPSSNVTVTTTRTNGDADLTVSSGGSLTFTPSNWDTPQTVTLAAAQDSDTAAGTASFSVTGTGTTGTTVTATEVDDDATTEQSIIVSPTSVTVPEGSTGTYTVRLAEQPSSSLTVTSTAGSGDADLTVSSGASRTFTTSNWNTPQTVTLAAAQDSDTANGTRTFTVASAGLTSRTVTATEADNDGGTNPGPHVENPYAGATGYVNPNWSAKAAAEPGGSAVADVSTAVWMDRIAAIGGSADAMSLREHLDEAVSQDAANGSAPLTIQVVIYNLPNRDCAALASNGELRISENGFNRYQNEYINPIADILDDPQYANLRIVTIIEPDSLPNLVTNIDSFEDCREANGPGGYRDGVRYALDQLHAIPNVYTYVDAAHHAWLGWDSNFQPAVDLFYETVAATEAGVDSVDGFIVNTANYSITTEPHFTINTTVNGTSVRQSDWVDWNYYIDELTFARDLRDRLIAKGFRSGLGMLIDTSRNGWGGSDRPGGPSSSTNVNQFVDESRADQRIHAGNWCNQSGAGMGARPTASPASGLDAYVWVKPPGESDGSSEEIDNDQGKRFDQMCDPAYTGNDLNGHNLTGALPDAPISGQWFSAQFRELLANAYPPIN